MAESKAEMLERAADFGEMTDASNSSFSKKESGVKFGIVIDEHIYLYHYELDMCKQQNEIIPWEYMDSKKYIGDTWWFDDEEIINDIQQLPLTDFLEKYKGY